jgi:hypothetical protein
MIGINFVSCYTPSSHQVAPRNLVSRIDADPPPPARVTHVAFSSDGSAMATLDVTDGLQVCLYNAFTYFEPSSRRRLVR